MVHCSSSLFSWLFKTSPLWSWILSVMKISNHVCARQRQGKYHILMFIVILASSVMSSYAQREDYSHCPNQILNQHVGRIKSPGFPNYFQPFMCRLWSMYLMKNQNITITFDMLEIPKVGDKCDSYLAIGPKPFMRVCGTASKASVRPYTSNNELVWIRFYTTNTSLPGKGFDLEFIISPVPAQRCSHGEFLCRNRKCIRSSWKCNGISECGDGSDETGCQQPWYGNRCGPGHFMCKSKGRWQIECFPKAYWCDGSEDCLDGSDERTCVKESVCGEQFNTEMGYITSPHYDHESTYPKNKDCNWTVHVNPGYTVQFRFVSFDLAPSTSNKGDSITFYDGKTTEGEVIGSYNYYQKPPKVVESLSNLVFIKFHSGYDVMDLNKRGFNMSFQQKGICLPNQNKCIGENNCYNHKDECDWIWDCQHHGSDERGCDICDSTKYPCGSGNQCFTETDHCNGMAVCFNSKDELNCTPEICNTYNGTFLCRNFRCIFESWLCDGRDDCGDNSDEINCTVPSVRVILAAVIGSLVCALLLVIAIGCIIRLFYVRFHEHHGSRHETPMSRIQADFNRRQAPPTYTEAMRTSRPFSEFIAQIRSASCNLRGNRSRSGSDVDLLVPPGDDEGSDSGGRTEGADNSVTENGVAEPAQVSRRHSDTSDSSCDSTLISIHTSNPGPSTAAYNQELDEELSPNATSCIDISSAHSSSGTTVQWTRDNHVESGAEPNVATSQTNTENEPLGETLCSGKLDCDSESVDSGPDTDVSLLNVSGSTLDINESAPPVGCSTPDLSDKVDVEDSTECLPTPKNHQQLTDVTCSNENITEQDVIQNLPKV